MRAIIKSTHTNAETQTVDLSLSHTRVLISAERSTKHKRNLYRSEPAGSFFSFPATKILIPAESRCSLHLEQLLTLRTQHLNTFKPTVYWSVCVFAHVRLDSRPRFHHSQTKLHLSDLHTLQKSDTGIISFHEH